MKSVGQRAKRPSKNVCKEINQYPAQYPTKNKLRILLALNLLLAGCMAYFYATFPTSMESKIVLRQELRPTKIPNFFLYLDVRIRTAGGSGSGAIVSKKLAITNNHVVKAVGKGGTLWVDWDDENGPHSNVATVVALDEARDLAIVSLAGDAAFTHHVSIAEKALSWGDPIIVVGSPAGLYPVPTTGTFVKKALKDGMDMIQADVFFGNSGGPVFDAISGQLIGLTSRMCAGGNIQVGGGVLPVIATYVFLAVPASWIMDFLSENNVRL